MLQRGFCLLVKGFVIPHWRVSFKQFKELTQRLMQLLFVRPELNQFRSHSCLRPPSFSWRTPGKIPTASQRGLLENVAPDHITHTHSG